MRALRLSVAMAAVLAVAAMPAAAVADEHVEVMGGVVNGVMTQDYENPMGCAEWVLADGTIMPAPTHNVNATGMTNLLGSTTLTTAACYDAANMFENVVDGQWTMAGEGEDSLSGTYDANCVPDFSPQTGVPWECFGEWAITDGTGAYEGASGRLGGVATFMGTGFSEDGLMLTVPTEMRFEGIVAR